MPLRMDVDFADDGASFRVCRARYLAARFPSAVPKRPLPLSVRIGLTAAGLSVVAFGLWFVAFVAVAAYVLITG